MSKKRLSFFLLIFSLKIAWKTLKKTFLGVHFWGEGGADPAYQSGQNSSIPLDSKPFGVVSSNFKPAGQFYYILMCDVSTIGKNLLQNVENLPNVNIRQDFLLIFAECSHSSQRPPNVNIRQKLLPNVNIRQLFTLGVTYINKYYMWSNWKFLHRMRAFCLAFVERNSFVLVSEAFISSVSLIPFCTDFPRIRQDFTSHICICYA